MARFFLSASADNILLHDKSFMSVARQVPDEVHIPRSLGTLAGSIIDSGLIRIDDFEQCTLYNNKISSMLPIIRILKTE